MRDGVKRTAPQPQDVRRARGSTLCDRDGNQVRCSSHVKRRARTRAYTHARDPHPRPPPSRGGKTYIYIYPPESTHHV
jgi:hypothetical protein